MAGYDPQEVIVAGEGAVYLAPKGTTMPTASRSALNPAFAELGIYSEDSGQITIGREISDIMGHKKPWPVRKIEQSRLVTVSGSFRQWFTELLEAAFNGTISEVSPGEFVLDPVASGVINEYALVVDWEDWGSDFRFVMPSCVPTENVETPLRRTENSVLPLTFGLTDPGEGIQPFRLFTNFPALAPVGS